MTAPKRREYTMDSIIEAKGPGIKVAKFLFPYFEKCNLTVKEITERLGLANHTNVSMIKSGKARMSVDKAPLFAEMLKCPDFELGHMVFESNYDKEYKALKKMGVIITAEERRLLDVLLTNIPLGDFDSEMIERIESAISNI